MPGLGETTAMLARLRRQAESFSMGGGGEARLTETTDFGSNPAALRMLSYAPQGLPQGAPLVVVLHGCTQRAEAHAEAGGWLTLAERFGFMVIAPEQTSANNPNRCFNWYEPAEAQRDRGEAASIRAMVAHAVRQHGLDPRRVFVTGLSAGGAMTSVMLAAYPEVFAAGAIVAGLPFGVADNVQEALGAMYGGRARSSADLADLVRRAAPAGAAIPRVSIWHGSADSTVRPHNALEIAKQWAAVHGLPEQPSETEVLPGRTRMLWRASADGEVLIESNLIAGFGHGTPLSASGPDAIGAVAPFMLEAGVSSSLEIARFWGIADAAAELRGAAKPQPEAPLKPRIAEPQSPSTPASGSHSDTGIGEQVMATVSKHVPAEVQGVIAKALKTAGLMK